MAIKIATKKVLKRTVDSPANPNFKYKKHTHTHTYRLKWVLRSHWQRIYHFLLLYYIYFAGSAKSRAEKNATNSKQPISVSFPTLLKNKKILTLVSYWIWWQKRKRLRHTSFLWSVFHFMEINKPYVKLSGHKIDCFTGFLQPILASVILW